MNKVLAVMRNVVIIAIQSENAYLKDNVAELVPPTRQYGASRLDCNVVGIPPGLNFGNWISFSDGIYLDTRIVQNVRAGSTHVVVHMNMHASELIAASID